MGLEEEKTALLRSELLPEHSEIDQVLWGVINGGRLDMREGILFISGEWWGFYGRDFEFLTHYAGFAGYIPLIEHFRGPISSSHGMPIFRIEGEIEDEGLLSFQFVPDAMSYRKKMQIVEDFFEFLRLRLANLLRPEALSSFRQGIAHWEAGKQREAEELLWQAHRLDDRSAVPPYYLGELLLERDASAALPLFEEARQKGYEDQTTLSLMLAKTHLEMEQFYSAEREAQQVLSQSEHAEAYMILSELESARGHQHKALKHLQQAVLRAPDIGHYQAMLAYRSAEVGDFALTHRTLLQLNHEYEAHPATLMARALVAIHEENELEAVEILERVLELEPDFEPAQTLLSECTPEEEIQDPGSSDLPNETINNEVEISDQILHLIEEHSEQLAPTLLQSTTKLQNQIEAFAQRFSVDVLSVLNLGSEEQKDFQDRMQTELLSQIGTFFSNIHEPLESTVRQTLQEIGGQIPKESNQLFAAYGQGIVSSLSGVLRAANHYALGLLEGGLLRSFIQETVGRLLGSDAMQMNAQLQKHLRPITQKLSELLENWRKEYGAELGQAYFLALGVQSSTTEDSVERRPESTRLDVRAPSDILQEIQEKTEEAPIEAEPPPPPIPPTPKMMQRAAALRRPLGGVRPVKRERRIQKEKKRAIPKNPWDRGPDAPRPVTKKDMPASVHANAHPIQHSLRAATEKRTTGKTKEQVYEEYIAACNLIGKDTNTLHKGRFLLFIEEKMKTWEQRTGRKAECFIRIEDGKPKIKIREFVG